MLTTTYSLVAINLEQKNAYKLLSRFEQDIKYGNGNSSECVNSDYLKKILNEFMQIESYFRSRTVEVYVIPAIRKATETIDSLLAEFESLNELENKAIRTVVEQIQWAIDKNNIQADLLLSSMEQYCQSLLKRLVKEEEQLLPVAKNVLTGDAWFDIAVECMSGDTKTQDRKPSTYVPDQLIFEHISEMLPALST
jgi:DUF438 domain-containing protein